MSTSALTEHSVRLRLNAIIRNGLTDNQEFIPRNAIRNMALWLLSLQLTETEKAIASKLTKDILMEYERRLRWVGQELESEVFKRYGG
jgi:hypothetical protein